MSWKLAIGVGLAAVAVSAIVAERQWRDDVPATEQRAVSPPAAPSVAAANAPAPVETSSAAAFGGEAGGQAIRDVTPSGFSRVFNAPTARPAPSASGTQRVEIANAGAKPDGTIVWPEGALTLHGVAFPEPHKICRDEQGTRWPCGKRAYIALHNRISGAKLECEIEAASATSMCFIGKTNLSAWLLGQGLVRARGGLSDKDLLTAEAEAKRAKLGLWLDPREIASASAEQSPR